MKLSYGCCALVMLGLVGCGGTSGSTQVTGADTASIQSAPAGVATLQFMDLETIRPDMLASGTALPTGVTSGSVPPAEVRTSAAAASPSIATTTTRYTFNQVTAANGGILGGYIDVTASTPVIAGGVTTTTYDEHFALTLVPKDSPNSLWTYSGDQELTVSQSDSGNSATLGLVGGVPMTLTYAASPTPSASDKTYTFAPALTASWSGSGDSLDVTLAGTYVVAQTLPLANASILTCTLTNVTWGPATTCKYPVSGSVALVMNSIPPASATVVFTSTCGQITLNGAKITLGS